MTHPITPQHHSSLVGGSTASRRIGCPRSYALEQLVPDTGGGSVYAQEGTALHELMALALEHDKEPTELLPFVFTTNKDGGWTFTVDHDLWLDKGEPALRAFDTFVTEQERRLDEPMQFLIETRVEFPGVAGAFGTSDIIGRCGNEVFVLDWKFGRGVVPAEENKQLMFYACGALNTSREFFRGMKMDHTTPVTLAIIQPMRPGVIDTWTTDLLRLHHFEIELLQAVEYARQDGINAPIQDGAWCQYARCKTICPLHLGAAAKLASNFERLQTALTSKTTPAPVNDMPERYADMLDLVDMVEDWCKEVREQAHANAERGMAIPGWALEPGRKGPRKWAIDEAEVVKAFTGPEFGLDPDVVAPRKVLTLPQLEKILKRDDRTIPEGFTAQSEPSTTRLVRVENATTTVEPTAAKAQALAEKLMRL
jgi:hypothetical protein